MFWKVFKAELAAIFGSNKLNIIKWSAVILIPFIYAFTYLYAFWNPYQYLDNLKLVIVDNDSTYNQNLNIGKAISDGLTQGDIRVEGYKINIDKATAHSNIDNLLKDYYAVIEVPTNFTANTVDTIEKFIIGKGQLTDLPQIVFNNSFKNNFLVAEIGGFASGMTQMYSLGLKATLPGIEKNVIDYINNTLKDPTATVAKAKEFFVTFSQTLDQFNDHPIFRLNARAEKLNSYGFGLAPYFLCIGLWVGQLVQHFMVTKKRKIKNVKFMSNYFGKSLFLMMNATVQSLVLLAGLSCIGLRFSGWNEVSLIIFVVLMAMLFTLIIQAVMFVLRKPDIGRFVVIILLVLQLASSSGTFPVALQPAFFRAISHVLPFTYTIQIIREIFYAPIYLKILIDSIILLSFLLLVPACLWINIAKEKKTKKTYDEEENELTYLS